MAYNAFISYSHAADGKLAPAVQSALHQFARSWYQVRALKVFRDETSLSATPELWPSIEKALGDSEYFLLLASPQAAESKWVQKEIDWWLQNRSAEKIFILLTEGEIQWEEGKSDFNWKQTTALPPNLQGQFKQEPLYVDLRWARKEEGLSLRNSQFRSAILDIAAPLHRREKDELDGDDIRQHHKTRNLVRWAVTLLSMLTLIAVGAAYVAIRQRDQARHQESRAELEGIKAIQASLGEKTQRRKAVASAEEARKERDNAIGRLGQLHVNNALGLAREGDAFGAMSWFAEALRRDHGNSTRAYQYRVQLGLYSRTQPRLLHSWIQQQPVTFAEFSPDGRRIATASGMSYPREETSGEARVWDARTGKPVSPPLRHAGTVYSACFSPDGARVLTAGGDGYARIWDVKTGQLIVGGIRPGYVVRRARFSPDGRRVATAGRTAQVWDATSGEPVTAPLTAPDRAAWHVEFSPDGTKLLATYGSSYLENYGAARIWDAASGEPITPLIEGRGAWVYSGAFSPDGTRFVLADGGGEAQVFATASGQPLGHPIKHANRVAYAAFSQDGLRLINAGWDGNAYINRADGTQASPAKLELPPGEQIRQAALSPDGQLLITGSSGGTARVWDTYAAQPLSPPLRLSLVDYPAPNLFGPGETPGPEFAVGFAPDGHRVVTAGWDGTVRIWDLAGTPATSISLPEEQSPQVQVSSPEPRVAFERRETAVLVTETASGRQLTLPMAGAARTDEERARESIRAVYSADGKWLAIVNTGFATTGWLFVADTASFRARELTTMHPGPIDDVAFDPQSKRIFVVFGSDILIKGHTIYDKDFSDVTPGYVRAWDLKSLQPATPPFEQSSVVQRVEFDATGKRLVGRWDKGLRIWDAGSGKLLSGAIEHQKAINAVVFSPDGEYLATASRDATARVWHETTGAPITPPLSHGPAVNWLAGEGVVAIAFSADSTQLATVGADRRVRLWNVRTGQPLGPALVVSFDVHRMVLDSGRHEITVFGADGAHESFDISPMGGTPDELALLAQALSMRKFDASGVLVDLDRQEVSKLVARVNASPALRIGPTERQMLLWHKTRLAAALAYSRDRYSARFHRERIMAAEPAEPRWYLQRADERVAEGHPRDAVADYTKALELGAKGCQPWARRAVAHVMADESRQAAADFARAIELGDKDDATFINHLLLSLVIGDTRGYQETKALLIRVSPRPGGGTYLRDRVMRALAIGIYADSDCRDAVAFIRKKGGEGAVFGAADKYCDGDFEAARVALEDTIRRKASDKPSAEALMLSMVYHHLGNAGAASRWMARGKQWRSEVPVQQLIAADNELTSLIQWYPSLSVTPMIELKALERAAETLIGKGGQTFAAPRER